MCLCLLFRPNCFPFIFIFCVVLTRNKESGVFQQATQHGVDLDSRESSIIDNRLGAIPQRKKERERNLLAELHLYLYIS